MPPTVRFALNFSGAEVLEQQRNAERLLAATTPADHASRARLHTVLAATHLISAPDKARDAVAQSAAAAALATDPISHSWSLLAACIADLSCAATVDRLRMTEQILQTLQHAADPELVTPAYFLHLSALAELTDISGLDRALSPTGPLLSTYTWLGESRHVAWFRCLRATIDGRTSLAEQLAQDALQIALRQQDPDAHSVWLGQLAIIRWLQGQVVELEPAFLTARQQSPHEPIWAVSLAWMWLRQGRKSAARGLITSLPKVCDLPPDRNWLATACILAEVATELSETTIAADLNEALLPYRDRIATIGLGVTCWGTAARPLALTSAALGDLDAATDHYRAAIEVAARAGAHYWLAEAQSELATLLLQRGRDADEAVAVELAREAAATGQALQLHGIEGSASALLSRSTQTREPALITPTAETGNRPTIRVLGGFEVTAPDSSVARWQSRKARQLLRILIARRGVPINRESIMHMMWPDEPAERTSNRFSVALSTVRRVLDPDGLLSEDGFLESRDGMIRLRIEQLDIDVERFLVRAQQALDTSARAHGRQALLAETLQLYRGDPMADEADHLWAEELRREAHLAVFAVAHALAEEAQYAGDHLTRVEAYRKILALDEYDQRAHEGLVDALTALSAHGHAESARTAYRRSMAALGIGVRRHDDPAIDERLSPDHG